MSEFGTPCASCALDAQTTPAGDVRMTYETFWWLRAFLSVMLLGYAVEIIYRLATKSARKTSWEVVFLEHGSAALVLCGIFLFGQGIYFAAARSDQNGLPERRQGLCRLRQQDMGRGASRSAVPVFKVLERLRFDSVWRRKFRDAGVPACNPSQHVHLLGIGQTVHDGVRDDLKYRVRS